MDGHGLRRKAICFFFITIPNKKLNIYLDFSKTAQHNKRMWLIGNICVFRCHKFYLYLAFNLWNKF